MLQCFMAFKDPEKRRQYDRDWARRNSARRQEINSAWQQKRVAWYKEFKSNLKCSICSENHPACIQFHHRDGKDKSGAVSMLMQSWSEKRILEEMAKCDVVCANCHAKIHYNEKI